MGACRAKARKPFEPAEPTEACKPDKPAEAPPVASATAPGPDVANKNKNSLMLHILVSAFCEDQRRRREAVSGLVFFVVIVVLLSIYRKEPHCCKDTHGDMDAPPQYYSSRQTLVGNPCLEQTHDNTRSQSGQLFLIGLPSSYRLPSLEAPLPRLPSYESVRKKDRQRQIHMMIADRFGLNGAMLTEPPPTYEESIRHSIEVPFDILGSVIDAPHPQNIYPAHTGTDLTTQSEVTTQCPSTQDANSATLPV